MNKNFTELVAINSRLFIQLLLKCWSTEEKWFFTRMHSSRMRTVVTHACENITFPQLRMRTVMNVVFTGRNKVGPR